MAPKPAEPADLKHCSDCGKVIGPLKGWFGPECQCGQPLGDALRGAHGAGTRPISVPRHLKNVSCEECDTAEQEEPPIPVE